MPAPIIDPLPSAPSRGSESRTQFVLTTDAFLAALNPWGVQLQAVADYVDGIAGGSTPAWGVITGTLADQTDLQAALDAKLDAGDADLGDVSITSGVWSIDAGAVTLAKMADMATASVIYRKTGGTGVPEVQTLATLKTDLGLTGTNSGDQTTVSGNAGTATALASSRNFSIAGGGITASTVGFDGTAAVVLDASVDAGHITLARMADLATATVIGRRTAGTGVPEAYSVANLKTDLGLTGTNSGDQTTVSGNAGTATKLATARTIGMSGDVTWSSGSFDGSANVTAAGTIANSAVTNAKLADIATARFKGRVTASTGVVEDLTGTQATTLLDAFTDSLKGLAPASGGGSTNYLRADGSWAAPPGTGGLGDADYGDITIASGVWTIDPGVVTYAKMQNVSATSRILGRKTAGAGSTEELTLSEALDFVGSAAQGDILYRGAATWTRLGAGTSGNFLKTQGAGANPVWAAISGGGDMLASNNLSDVVSASTALSNIGGQPLDTQLTSLAGLSYSGNALKGVRVNAGETAFELATISGGGGPAVSSGSGNPASTPATIGDIYVDTTNFVTWMAKGTSSSADWYLTSGNPTLIEASGALSAATYVFDNIPRYYKSLNFELLGVSHDNGSNQTLRIELSGDNGSTYTGTANIGASTANTVTWYGAVQIQNYRKAAGYMIWDCANIASDSTIGNNGASRSWRIAAGINAVRFSPAAGNFDAGSINLWGL